MTKEEIEATAKELTKVPEIIQEVEIPKPEPVSTQKQVKTPWNYKVYAEALKAMISEHDTVEITADKLHEIFPQARCAGKVVQNLKNSYWLSYRRVEKGRNDTYVFFIEPTREELIVQLTSAESKVIELEKEISIINSINDEFIKQIWEENSKLKSDLSNQHIDKIILLWVAILSVISIILK